MMDFIINEPRPSALIESLRSVGYSLPAAVADIIDNSITAKARNIWIRFHWAGVDSHISVTDDGIGMSEDELVEAMRPGSRSPAEYRDPSDLGRFGLGLKTASFSQCRILTVLSKQSGTGISARTWDLDYVVHTNEWRLLKSSESAVDYTVELDKMDSGTVVYWGNLDRITQGENTGDAAAHSRFNDAIDNVRQHLALTFHRFIEAGLIRIHLNGHYISAWNPFLENHNATYRTPEELIPFGDSEVILRGYVLPHKDMLSSEEYSAAAGPSGWAAHQGFYVYRNRRLLVPGDWLRLGRPNPWTREEHYKLARIRLDLPNDTDNEWHLDVKKSTARPPAIIRGRLTDLAENIRSRARSVFLHRGKYGPRIPRVDDLKRPWEATARNGLTVYRINRSHPVVKAVYKALGKDIPEIETLLRVLEETVPVHQIWLDIAEQKRDQAIPYQGVDFSVIRADIRLLYSFLKQSGLNKETALGQIRVTEPYNRYTDLIDEMVKNDE